MSSRISFKKIEEEEVKVWNMEFCYPAAPMWIL